MDQEAESLGDALVRVAQWRPIESALASLNHAVGGEAPVYLSAELNEDDTSGTTRSGWVTVLTENFVCVAEFSRVPGLWGGYSDETGPVRTQVVPRGALKRVALELPERSIKHETSAGIDSLHWMTKCMLTFDGLEAPVVLLPSRDSDLSALHAELLRDLRQ